MPTSSSVSIVPAPSSPGRHSSRDQHDHRGDDREDKNGSDQLGKWDAPHRAEFYSGIRRHPGQPVELAPRSCQHAPGDLPSSRARPRAPPAPARPHACARDRGPASRQAARARQPPRDRPRRRGARRDPDPRRRRAAWRPRASRVIGGDRGHAAGRGLRGDHPERLGERARHRERVRGGHHVRDLVVLEAASDQDRPRRLPGGFGIARWRLGEEPGEDLEPLRVGALVFTAPLRNLPGPIEVAAPESLHERPEPRFERPEADEQQSRCLRPRRASLPVDERPGRGEKVDALVDQELADEEHALVSHRPGTKGGGDRRAIAAEGVPRLLAARELGVQSPGQILEPSQGPSAGLGRNRCTSTPGGPSRVRSLRVRSGTVANRSCAVCEEPTRTPAAASVPSRA